MLAKCNSVARLRGEQLVNTSCVDCAVFCPDAGTFLLNQAPDFFRNSLYSEQILHRWIWFCLELELATGYVSMLHVVHTFLIQSLQIFGDDSKMPKLQLHMRQFVLPLPSGLFVAFQRSYRLLMRFISLLSILAALARTCSISRHSMSLIRLEQLLLLELMSLVLVLDGVCFVVLECGAFRDDQPVFSLFCQGMK